MSQLPLALLVRGLKDAHGALRTLCPLPRNLSSVLLLGQAEFSGTALGFAVEHRGDVLSARALHPVAPPAHLGAGAAGPSWGKADVTLSGINPELFAEVSRGGGRAETP